MMCNVQICCSCSDWMVYNRLLLIHQIALLHSPHLLCRLDKRISHCHSVTTYSTATLAGSSAGGRYAELVDAGQAVRADGGVEER